MGSDDVRLSKDVEVKWGVHSAGKEREAWHEDQHRTTVLLLIKGRFRINLEARSHLLAKEDDYAMWGPGIGHSWRAEDKSIVITIRWPSVGCALRCYPATAD